MKSRLALLVVAAMLLAGCGLSDARNKALAESKVTALSLDNHWLPGLVGVSDYKSQGWGPDGYPGVTNGDVGVDPTASFLMSLGLQTADVTSSLSVKMIPSGDSLDSPTLDLCNGNFPSEELRVSRYQAATYTADGAFAGISSEAVQYLDADAAQQAIDELVAQRKACPSGTIYADPNGVKHTITYFTAPGPTSTRLVPASQRVILHLNESTETAANTYFVAVEVRGDTLVGLYGTVASDAAFNQTNLDALYAILDRMTARLQAADAADVGLD